MKISIVFKPAEKGSSGLFTYNSTVVLLRVTDSVQSLTDVYRVLNSAYLELYNSGSRGWIRVQIYEYYSKGEVVKGYGKFKKNYRKYIKVLDL